jgi:hypothetical protein
MNLAKTDLPKEVVSKLRGLNIRDVEALLSLTATPAGLVAIARVLGRSQEDVGAMARRLQDEYPDIAVSPAGGEAYSMGHVPPLR